MSGEECEADRVCQDQLEVCASPSGLEGRLSCRRRLRRRHHHHHHHHHWPPTPPHGLEVTRAQAITPVVFTIVKFLVCPVNSATKFHLYPPEVATLEAGRSTGL
ncbi:hypothetical protein E2C01_054095 [Portunus trituberculatus]|uniref:Uncharacterized protein n=1 Tax=Portunus trituberculatus TaxID=210409 RepID=A0A5B7GR38_PORTR|nr:hypothetical protein [Portunus trituberculatus]